MVFEELFDLGLGEAGGVETGLDEVGGIGLCGRVIFGVFGVDGVGEGGADGGTVHSEDTLSLDADYGGLEVGDLIGDGVLDGEDDGLAEGGVVGGETESFGVAGLEGDFVGVGGLIGEATSGETDVEVAGGQGLGRDEVFLVGVGAGNIFDGEIAGDGEAVGDQAVEGFQFGDLVVGESGKGLVGMIFDRFRAAGEGGAEASEGVLGGDEDKIFPAEAFDLVGDERIDTGVDGDIEDDGETADEDGENGEESAEPVAKEVVVGGTEEVEH